MPIVVGVRFKKTPKTYYFEAGNLEYTMGGGVIVETARGLELGTVAMLPTDIAEDKVVQPIKPVIRVATEEDKALYDRLCQKLPSALTTASEIVKKSGLDMKLTGAEYTFDGSKLVLYFTADNRVDFRELVRELATAFKTRIELKQIGARDECKYKGGLGPCGRVCCCCHTTDFAHVTIKMAKNQNLSLNPGKISGLCGRLMCCLSYENEYYAEVNKRMPKMGSEAKAGGKTGMVIGINQLKETVTLRINEKDIFTTEEFPLSEVLIKGRTGDKNAAQGKQAQADNDDGDDQDISGEVADDNI